LYANNLDDIQVYQSPGAFALRVHFSQIATAAGSGCFANSCDNIYLYDEDRDLYQVLNGTASDVTSVQIPGDTVRIRLVTNASGTAAGYTIDRVDVMGVALEAGVDAGAPADAASEAGTAEPNDGSVGDPPDASGGNPIDASSGSPDGSAGAGATDSGSTLDAGNSAGTNGGGAAGMPSANGGAGAASMPQGGNPGTNPDASTGAPDASTPTDSGAIAQTETASGCDCRLAGGTAHRGDPSASQPLAFLALLLTLRRRRRMR
ncbi:MAG TPA: hypothetical protein VHO25_13205, partial [Polyangiaceae bacterium]|nr:hypothetical protein [Polyangiaceae bacterium]